MILSIQNCCQKSCLQSRQKRFRQRDSYQNCCQKIHQEGVRQHNSLQKNCCQKSLYKKIIKKNHKYSFKKVLVKNSLFVVILNNSFFNFLVLNYDLFLLSRELRVNNLFNLVPINMIKSSMYATQKFLFEPLI